MATPSQIVSSNDSSLSPLPPQLQGPQNDTALKVNHFVECGCNLINLAGLRHVSADKRQHQTTFKYEGGDPIVIDYDSDDGGKQDREFEELTAQINKIGPFR